MSILDKTNCPEQARAPKVAVLVTAYNHEDYIRQCLESTAWQRGDFELEVIITEDHSTDKTLSIIEEFVKEHQNSRKDVSYVIDKHENNLGMVQNLKRVLSLVRDGDYDFVTFCEGDDYWIDGSRIQKHIDFLDNHPDCCMSFNQMLMWNQAQRKYELHPGQQSLIGNVFETRDLIFDNFIGNFSCCFYRKSAIDMTPDWLFGGLVADWLINIYLSMYGNIGYISDPITVYRIHQMGVWSGGKELENCRLLIDSIDNFNQQTNYILDKEFTEYRTRLVSNLIDGKSPEDTTILLVSDRFSETKDQFGAEELADILHESPLCKALVSDPVSNLVDKKETSELISLYKRKFPETKGQLQQLDDPDNLKVLAGKLCFFPSLDIAHRCKCLAENNSMPFVFFLNSTESPYVDDMDVINKLQTVTKSPFLHKIVVSQESVSQFLIDGNHCPQHMIELLTRKQEQDEHSESGRSAGGSTGVALAKVLSNIADSLPEIQMNTKSTAENDCADSESVLYIDTGNGFNEHDSVRAVMSFNRDSAVVFDLEHYSQLNVNSVRWDPLEGSYIKVLFVSASYTDAQGTEHVLELSASNGFFDSEYYWFLNKDPNMMFVTTERVCRICIRARVEVVSAEDVVDFCSRSFQSVLSGNTKENVFRRALRKVRRRCRQLLNRLPF